MSDRTSDTRRQFLVATGTAAVVSIAGCGGGGGGGPGEETTTTTTGGDGTTTTEEDETTTTEGGNGGNASDLGPVPSEYETATSIGGTQRDPESLQSKDAVNYQSQPNDDQQCSGCTFYVEDVNGDGLGACAIVEGTIEPDGWCVSFSPNE